MPPKGKRSKRKRKAKDLNSLRAKSGNSQQYVIFSFELDVSVCSGKRWVTTCLVLHVQSAGYKCIYSDR